MKILTRILGTVYILIGLAAIFFFSWVYIKPGIITISKNLLTKEMAKFGIGGFALILVGISWFIYWFDYKIRTKNIVFNSPHGDVKISLRAIEEFVSTKIDTHIKNIKTIRVNAYVGSRGLETVIYLKVPGSYNIPELSSQTQELIKNYLQDVVGVDRVSKINIRIQSIVSELQTGTLPTEVKNGRNP